MSKAVAANPFPVKLRKTKPEGDAKKSAGKFDVKLKKIKKPEDEKQDGAGFGVSLKKTDQRKSSKGATLELPKLKKINKKQKDIEISEKSTLTPRKKMNRVEPDGSTEDNKNPFEVKLKSRKKGEEADEDEAQEKRQPQLKRVDLTAMEKGLQDLEEESKRIELRKTRKREKQQEKSGFDVSLKPTNKTRSPEEEAAKAEKKRLKQLKRKEKEAGLTPEQVQLKKTRRQQKEMEKNNKLDVNLRRTQRREKSYDDTERIDPNLKRVERSRREGSETDKIDVNLRRVERNYDDMDEDERKQYDLKQVERKEKEYRQTERLDVDLKKRKKKEKKLRRKAAGEGGQGGGQGEGNKEPQDFDDDSESEDDISDEEFWSSSDSELDSSDEDDVGAVAPRAPGSPLARSNLDDHVLVSWQTKGELEDGVIGYKIERRENQLGEWVTINDQLVKEKKFVDTSVQASRIYEYRILSCNESKTSLPSDPSAPVRVKKPKAVKSTQETRVPRSPSFDLDAAFSLSDAAAAALPLAAGEDKKFVIRVKVGDPCPFTLPLVGWPVPKVDWTKDDVAPPPHVEFSSSEFETNVFIETCKREDAGVYTCRLENEHGKTHMTVRVIVCAHPAPPEGPLQLTAVGEASVSFSWKPPKDDGGAKVKGKAKKNRYIVERASANNPDVWEQIDVVEDCKCTATNLESGVEYFFRVSAENEFGKSDYLESEEPFSAKKQTASSPQNVGVESADTTSAMVTWRAPLDHGATPIRAYSVDQRDVGPTSDGLSVEQRVMEAEVLRDRCQDEKEVGWGQVTQVPGSETQALVKNLRLDRKYQFRVIPEHGDGGGDGDGERGDKSVPSKPFATSRETVAIDTGPFPPGKPENVVATKVFKDAVDLAWEEPEFDGGSPILGYLVEKRDAGGHWYPVNTSPRREQTLRVEALRPGEPVRFRVKAVTAAGAGDPSKPTQTIIPIEPSRSDLSPGTPEATSITTSSIALKWKAPVLKEEILGYYVEKKMKNGQWQRVNADLITSTDFCVENLAEDESHEFRVCVVDKSNCVMGASRSCDASTSAAQKDDITSIPLFDACTQSVTASTVHVKWSRSQTQNPAFDPSIKVVAYILEKEEQYNAWEQLPNSVPVTELVVADLFKGNAYQFRVRGVTSDGRVGLPGQPSDVIIARDPPAAPQVTSALHPVTVCVGQKIKIAARFSATPRPKSLWLKETNALILAERVSNKLDDECTELTIESCKRKDAGLYTLQLFNSHGSADCSCQVTVLGPPSSPNGPLTPTETTQDSVTIQWNAPDDDGGSPIFGYSVEIRKSGKKCWKVVEPLCAATTLEVLGLAPGAVYEFRVAAQNAIGNSEALESEDKFATLQKITDSQQDQTKKQFEAKAATAAAADPEAPPHFSFGLRPRRIQATNGVKLICCLEGNPYPKVTWFKDEDEINLLNCKFCADINAGVCSLDVSVCLPQDAGVYRCIAKNHLGVDETQCRISVEDIRFKPGSSSVRQTMTSPEDVVVPSPPPFREKSRGV